MIALWQHLLVSGQFKVIDHKFPEVGHSYLYGFRHRLRFNGSQVRKTKKGTYTVQMSGSNIDLMKNVKKTNKFRVTDISLGLIAGKLISQKLKPIKRQKKTDKGKVEFSKIRSIKVEKFVILIIIMTVNDDANYIL